MRVVLGVSGGIAAYKAAALCSALVQRGDDVDVVMTEGARRFVAPLTFAALTQRPVLEDLWDAPETIPHIALARGADVIAIVPATAHVIASLALGLASDLLGNIVLAARGPLVVAPAMNSAMYDHAATRGHLATLAARGATIVPPGTGFLAEREPGVGRLAETEAILAALDRAWGGARDLAGERVLVTAGPPREAIAPVRFFPTASTGPRGSELARPARRRGAHVELVLGPTLVEPPPDVGLTRVTSAREMHEAALARIAGCTIAIATAAVSDFRPATSYARKVKKDAAELALALERTPDIVRALGDASPATFLVGFAAETHDVETYAREKLVAKGLHAIAVNDVGRAGIGFGTGENELVVLWPGGREALARAPKALLADRLLDALLRIRAAAAAPSGRA
ncbi:MAG: bifunctional phosphopantothenoylcysteine decarboxylase/phosphopantothenate--cysteine ligase CoaBC [Vulcanimicrobiaceae bacterium]